MNYINDRKKYKQYQQKDKQRFDKFSILNGRKYFYSGIFQNYVVFVTAKKYIKYWHYSD